MLASNSIWKNWGPRVGFNYKLDDAGTTVLRGNWGRFYRTAITGEVAEFILTSFIPRMVLNPETGMYDIPGPK